MVDQEEKYSQIGQPKPFSKAVQYYPREMENDEKMDILNQSSLQEFLDTVYPRWGSCSLCDTTILVLCCVAIVVVATDVVCGWEVTENEYTVHSH